MKIKTTLHLISTLTFLLLLASAATPPEWTSFRSEEGQFKVIVPGAMTTRIDTATTAIGEVVCQNHFHKAATDSTTVFYSISFCDYPPNSLHADSIELMDLYFQSTIQSLVQELNGTLLYQSVDRLDTHPAYLWKISYDEGQRVAKFKSAMIKNRLYLLQVRHEQGRGSQVGANRYLGSFVFLI